jgi:hypothetical protein
MTNEKVWVNLRMPGNLWFLWICFLWMGSLVAQPRKSVFLQTENQVTFRVAVNGAGYISSGQGKSELLMEPGVQTVQISFDRQPGILYTFRLEESDEPQAFMLRQQMNNSWILYNLATAEIITGLAVVNKIKKMPVPEEDNINDSFTPPPLFDYKPPTAIMKIFERASPEGTDQIFLISTDNGTDTVALFIPASVPEQTAAVGLPGNTIRYSLTDPGYFSGLFTHRYKRYPWAGIFSS